MTVQELIKKLKKMPQDLEVGLAAFDMPVWLAGDWACSVFHIIKDECTGVDAPLDDEETIFDDLPDEFVTIHG